MKFRALLALAVLFAVFGCAPQEGDVNSAEKNAKEMKEFNDAKMKENPPPPGEGPSG